MTHAHREQVLTAIARALTELGAALQALQCASPEPTGSDPWISPTTYLRGVIPARVVNAACATGQIQGATKKGKRWLSRREAVDRWVSTRATEEADGSGEELVSKWAAKARKAPPSSRKGS